MPHPVFFSLLFYIGTLAATHTAYGGRFMVLRWVALMIVTAVSAIYWVYRGSPLRVKPVSYGSVPVLVYLGITLISVIAAENLIFSGLKWATHAMLLLTCMIFLLRTLSLETSNQLMFIIKLVTAVLLFLSILKPDRMTILDTLYFRGAMGDPNSMGHIAAICALIYLHGAVTGRTKWLRVMQLMVAIIAIIFLLLSGARSSMVLLLVGMVLTNFYYGLTRSLFRSLLAKSVILISIALLLTFARPTLSALHSAAMNFITKDIYHSEGLSTEKIFSTRERLWYDAWDGFKRRPILGWGFGAIADITTDWSIRPTSMDVLRDVTSDFFFTLEGSGLVGFVAYLGLIFSILRQSPTRQQISRLRKSRRIGLRTKHMLLSAYYSILTKSPVPGREVISQNKIGNETSLESIALPEDHRHAIFYILSVSQLVLFLFDCSAFSAGSIISAIFWMSTGAAGLLHSEAVKNQQTNHRLIERVQGVQGPEFEKNRID
jgi:O-antigen ligase